MRHLLTLLATLLLALPAHALWAPGDAPFVNTWLVLGTFDNRDGAGMAADVIGEAAARPRAGEAAAGKQWRYFDDRVFSRNYDDYQDLFSWFFVKQSEPRGGRLAYLHTYVWSPEAQAAELRLGGHQEFAARVNGELALSVPPAGPLESAKDHRLALRPGMELRLKDAVKRPIRLQAGWNSLLVKVGTRAEGPLGCYLRLCDAQGNALPGLACSPHGSADKLAVTTPELPAAWREEPYVAFQLHGVEDLASQTPELAKFNYAWPQASEFRLCAEGQRPAFQWKLVRGKLPDGLALTVDGRLTGRTGRCARLGEHRVTVRVTDKAGASAERELVLNVRENPARAFEQARLVALVHAPEQLKPEWYPELARLMKRQGYGYVMPISYGNGDTTFRWPVRFGTNHPYASVMPALKKAFEAEDIRFGMYVGQFDGCPPDFTFDEVLLVLEDAVLKHQPACFFFDWVGTPQHYPDTDAWFSMLRSYNPECVLVVNADRMPQNGDWDIPCIEGSGDLWNCWPGEHLSFLYPMLAQWPKTYSWDSWRTVDHTWGEVAPEKAQAWTEYVKSVISLIGEGHIADFDHTVRTSQEWATNAGARFPPAELRDNATIQAHQRFADWANPAGLPSLVPSYTQVDPGPLKPATWGYNVISADRRKIYLHLLANPRGKTGLPSEDHVTVGPLAASSVRRVVWMNGNRELKHARSGDGLSIALAGVTPDPADTILAIELKRPLPEEAVPRLPPVAQPFADEPKPDAANLAWRKPARLLSLDGLRDLTPCQEVCFASLGVDGNPRSYALGGGDWAWRFQVDLGEVKKLSRIRLRFARGYPTDYAVKLSANGQDWTEVHRGSGVAFGTYEHVFAPSEARFISVLSYKPNGPGQEGVQMAVAELEAYGEN